MSLTRMSRKLCSLVVVRILRTRLEQETGVELSGEEFALAVLMVVGADLMLAFGYLCQLATDRVEWTCFTQDILDRR